MTRFLMALALLLLCVPIFAAESDDDAVPFITNYGLRAGAVFPVGEKSQMYRIGGGGTFTMEHRLKRLNFLNFYTGLGFRDTPLLDRNSHLMFVDLRLGAGIGFELFPRFHFNASVGGGPYMAILTNPTDTGWGGFLEVSGQFGFDIGRSWRLGVGAEYTAYFGLADHVAVFLSVSHRTDFHLDDPLVSEPVEVEPFYTFLLPYYDAGLPLGSLVIRNGGNRKWVRLDADYTVPVLSASSSSIRTDGELDVGNTTELFLTGNFKPASKIDLDRGPFTARTNLRFRYKGWPLEHEFSSPVLSVSESPATDPDTAAVFVASRDDAVRHWSGALTNNGVEVSKEINPGLVGLAAVYTGLQLLGFSVDDAGRDSWAVLASGSSLNGEDMPFPGRTLSQRRGDRSESALLVAASLEAQGLESGLALIDGRLWPMAALGEGRERIEAEYTQPDDLVFIDDIGWAVVDLTVTGSLVEAIASGARAWRGSKEEPIAVKCRAAWEKYPQAGYSRKDLEYVLPDAGSVSEKFEQQVEELARWELERRKVDLQSAIDRRGTDTNSLNAMGALLARYGLRDEASPWFERVLLLEDDARSLVNLGNINYLAGDLTRARTYYNQASRVDPFNPYVLLGIARVAFEQENFGTSREAYSKLEIVDAPLADRFSILKGVGPEALQQALDSDLRRVVFWLD